MTSSPREARILRFGVFEADLRRRELRKSGLKLRLSGQPFLVLSILLEHAGEAVPRETLRRAVWASDTFVDFDRGLNKTINAIRQVLGDSASSPRFIETLSRRGYRFIAPVSFPANTSQASQVSPGKRRLLVLPFDNLSEESQQEYFSDGLTEEMIAQLGRLNPDRLGVIARTSAMQYKATRKSAAEIGRELNVDYILEGSVRRFGNRSRITAQLIQAGDETHLWSKSYEYDVSDTFFVQEEVSRSVSTSLAFELLPGYASPEATPFRNVRAHDAYLQGLHFWAQRTETALKTAIEFFEQTLLEEPHFASAHIGLSNCYAMLSWYGAVRPADAAAKAKASAVHALELSGKLGEAHCALALILFWYEWNWEDAEKEFRAAIALNPNHAHSHLWYGAFLASMGRTEEAFAESQHAKEMDPLSLIIASASGDLHYYARDYQSAIAHYSKVLAREPRFAPSLFQMGRAHLQLKQFGPAIDCMRKTLLLSGNRESAPAFLAHALASAGKRDEASSLLEQLRQPHPGRYVPSPPLALAFAALDRFDEAFQYLRAGLAESSCWMPSINADPVYDIFRTDSRFQDILQSMNL
jgi:TolB-like protein/tetratricopeptide (TPR) repeat protein